VLLEPIIRELNHIIGLHKSVATYYRNKPNKTPEEIESYNSHQYFIGELQNVL
jgi:hypothetical protein